MCVHVFFPTPGIVFSHLDPQVNNSHEAAWLKVENALVYALARKMQAFLPTRCIFWKYSMYICILRIQLPNCKAAMAHKCSVCANIVVPQALANKCSTSDFSIWVGNPVKIKQLREAVAALVNQNLCEGHCGKIPHVFAWRSTSGRWKSIGIIMYQHSCNKKVVPMW